MPKGQPDRQRDWALIARRVGYIASFLTVAGVAARVSYGHIRDVVLYVHQPVDVAHLLPLSVDGLMLIATLAMAEDKAHNRHPRGWARWGFWFGAAISTAANVEAVVIVSGWDLLGISVGAAAPILLLWSIEIVARPGKPRLVAVVQAALSNALAPAIPATVPVVQDVAVVTTPEPAPVPEPEPEPVMEPEPDDVIDDEPTTPRRRRPARTTVSSGVKAKGATVNGATTPVMEAAFIEPTPVMVD